eukprot:TRINITY_DN20505_c0_g1_i1.p1 TRINITY_DN20505_c0_g1~~TRINITY_DN20505_c0_g1_i1.p1  ORF type:complete len:394 (+),score=111.24 TRINITY_DN20505_c0_g1_i1:54-1235(+)
MQQEQQLWTAWAPWLYKSVCVMQLDSEAVSLDADTQRGDTGALRVLTATNKWPRPSADLQGGDVSAAIMLGLPSAPQGPAQEFAATEPAKPSHVASVLHKRHILRARCLRQQEDLAVVKLTDGVVLDDLHKGSTFRGTIPLPSARQRNIGPKSAALACQPGGTLAVFTDYQHPPHNQGGMQSVLLWDVLHNSTPDPRRHTVLQVDGKVEDVCFQGGQSGHDIIWCSTSNGYLRCVDIRVGGQVGSATMKRECIATNSMALHTVSSNASGTLVATAGSEALMLWDCRATGRGHLMAFDHAGLDVTHASWHPSDDAVLASATPDGRVWVWDLSLFGPTDRPAQTLPPELVFLHCGHSAALTDLAWHPSQPYTIMSADKQAFLHIFSPLTLHTQEE